MSKTFEQHRTWLCHTGCVLGQKDRGVSGPDQMFLNSSQGLPKRTDRERRMRHATGNSSIHLFYQNNGASERPAEGPRVLSIINLLLLTGSLISGGGLFALDSSFNKAPVKQPENKVYRQIGDAYEGLLLKQMYAVMKPPTDTSPGNIFAPSNGEKIFEGMRDDMMLDAMSKNHLLGISDMVVRQLEGKGGVRTQGRVE